MLPDTASLAAFIQTHSALRSMLAPQSIATCTASARGLPSRNRLLLRQQQVVALVPQRHPGKAVAADLKLTQRTVESQRRAIMRATDAGFLPARVGLPLGVA